MKYLIYLFFISSVFVSCETEDIIDTQKSVDTETNLLKRGNSTVLSLQELKEMNSHNAEIISIMLLWNQAYRDIILNSLDPVTKTVSMNILLDSNNNAAFLQDFIQVANYSRLKNYPICGNPDQKPPFPPGDGDEYYPPSGSSYLGSGQALVDLLLNNKTEIYIPNVFSLGDIYSVGHPIEDVIVNSGSLIYENSLNWIDRGVPCTQSSESTNISNGDVGTTKNIILSRPDFSKNNPYPFINFDIKSYLRAAPGQGNGSIY